MELNNHGDLKAQNYFCDSHKKSNIYTNTLPLPTAHERGNQGEKHIHDFFFLSNLEFGLVIKLLFFREKSKLTEVVCFAHC